MELFTMGFLICLLSGFACFWLFYKCIDWFEKFERRKIYVYRIIYCECNHVRLLMYVLVKPEKF